MGAAMQCYLGAECRSDTCWLHCKWLGSGVHTFIFSPHSPLCPPDCSLLIMLLTLYSLVRDLRSSLPNLWVSFMLRSQPKWAAFWCSCDLLALTFSFTHFCLPWLSAFLTLLSASDPAPYTLRKQNVPSSSPSSPFPPRWHTSPIQTLSCSFLFVTAEEAPSTPVQSLPLSTLPPPSGPLCWDPRFCLPPPQHVPANTQIDLQIKILHALPCFSALFIVSFLEELFASPLIHPKKRLLLSDISSI